MGSDQAGIRIEAPAAGNSIGVHNESSASGTWHSGRLYRWHGVTDDSVLRYQMIRSAVREDAAIDIPNATESREAIVFIDHGDRERRSATRPHCFTQLQQGRFGRPLGET